MEKEQLPAAVIFDVCKLQVDACFEILRQIPGLKFAVIAVHSTGSYDGFRFSPGMQNFEAIGLLENYKNIMQDIELTGRHIAAEHDADNFVPPPTILKN